MNRFRKAAISAGVALCAFAALPVGAATIFVNADIATSETWTADNEYVLTRPIYVTSGATLTIEAGTLIRGEGESAPGANDPGALIIARGSKIFALGTATHPIVFTNLDDDNIGANPGNFPYDTAENALSVTGTWGGVILLGRGYVANNTLAGPNGAREIQIEGLTAAGGLGLYGNCAASSLFPASCDDDDSGVMQYVSIRYGGFNLSANNEINGLTLGAVGRSTDLDHIEVFQNKDDGIEFFGGAASIKHLMAIGGGDDGLDYDEGWRGKAQFVMVMQGTPGADKSDKGGEHDGGNNPDGSQPRAVPTVYNATFVGLGQKAYTNKNLNTGLHIRDNAGARYYNSLFADFGGASMLIEGGSTSCSAAGSSGQRYAFPYTPGTGNCSVTTSTACDDNSDCLVGEVCVLHYIEADSDFELEFQDNCFWCFGAASNIPGGKCSISGTDCCATADCPGGETCNDTAPTYGGDTGKIHRGNDPAVAGDFANVFSSAALDNDYLACATPLPIRALVRVPSGNPATPDPIGTIDPLPAAGALTTDRTPPSDGFFASAPYKGAFGPSKNWAEGWTNTWRLGYFPPKPQVPVNADIAVSTLWTADNEYILTRPVYVTSGATLTIEPGTVVRGEGESAPGANDPGALIIARGSKIQAVGTADCPIVFTNLDDTNVGPHLGEFPYDTGENAQSVTGTWGGVILLGRGYVANNSLAGPNGAREIQIEGLTAAGGLGLYGNCAASGLFPASCDDDDSGMIQYVSIRYGGFNLSANNEINGLTLGAVGRSTDLDHIEVFQNKDDGIEFFGGAAGIKHLMAANGGDDGLDYDEGWRGKAQFVFVMQGTPGADKSDKGGEHDGGNNPDGSQPRAVPTVYNATFVGLGQKAYTNKNLNTALHIRDNAGVRYHNTLFADFGGAPMLIEGGSTSCNAAASSGQRYAFPYTPGTGNCSVTTSTACDDNSDCLGGEVCVLHYLAPDSDFELQFRSNRFWCFGASSNIPGGKCSISRVDCCSTADCGGGGTCTDSAPTFGGDTGKIHRGNDPAVAGDFADVFSNATLDNDYLACNDPLPIRALTRVPSGNPATPDPIGFIDPLPVVGGALTTGAIGGAGSPVATAPPGPPDDGFFEPAPHRGAFGKSSWGSCWSNLGRLGIFPRCDRAAGLTAVPDEVERFEFTSATHAEWAVFAPASTCPQLYDVVRADDPQFATAVCIKTDDVSASVDDTDVPASGDVLYYLVRGGNACGEGTFGYESDASERIPGFTCP